MDEAVVSQKEWLNGVFDNPKIELTPEQTFAMKFRGETRLDTICNVIKARTVDRNYDAPVPITGFEGSGKSSLGAWMGYKISRKSGVPFSLYRNVLYYQPDIDQYDQLQKMLLNVHQYGTVMVDEAIKTMYARNWSKGEQKEQNMIFTSIRDRNLFVPMLIPQLGEIDSFFKQYRSLWWIHIFKRGVAGLFVKDPNPFNPDPFNIKTAFSIIKERQNQQANMFDVNEMIKTLRDHVLNFLTWFRVSPLPRRTEALYKKLKHTYRDELPQQEKSTKEQLNALLETSIVSLYEADSRYTADVLAKKFSVSIVKVRRIINRARDAESGFSEVEQEGQKEEPEEEGVSE